MVYITGNIKKIFRVILPIHLTLFITDFGTTAFYFIKFEGFTEGNFFYAKLGYSLEVTIVCVALFLISMYSFLYLLNTRIKNLWVGEISVLMVVVMPLSNLCAFSMNFLSQVTDMSLLWVALLPGLCTVIFGISLFYYLMCSGYIWVRKGEISK